MSVMKDKEDAEMAITESRTGHSTAHNALGTWLIASSDGLETRPAMNTKPFVGLSELCLNAILTS